MKIVILGVIGVLSCGVQVASACDGRLSDALEWTIRENGRNCSNNDAGQIRFGACKKDAVQLSSGYHGCQHGDAIGIFESCSAGQQIDTARALGLKWNVFHDKAACGM